MSDLSIDIELVAARRKQRWMSEARGKMSIQDKVALSVPWWLIVIVVALSALSAGHTVGVFNQLSSVGYAAPFAVEFALLWAAFSRVGIGANGRVSLPLRVLELLAFVMALLVNAIGAAERVAALSNIGAFSFAQLLTRFGELPFVMQGVIIFIPFFAFFVPVGTWVAGEGLASLILRGRREGSHLDEQWREVARFEVMQALFAELTRRGLSANDAKKHASALSAGYIGGRITAVSDTRPILSEHSLSVPSVSALPDAPRVSALAVRRSSEPVRTDKKEVVRKWLESHADEVSALSVRTLAERVAADTGQPIGRDTAHRVLTEWRETH